MNAHGLMFHHFHDTEKHLQGQGSITAEEFADMIIYYKKEHNLLSAREWSEKALTNKLSSRDVCLTFDDSLRCQFDIALPVLENLGIKAFWFIYTLPLDNVIVKLELYRYYRTKEFEDINEFYNAFNLAVSKSEFGKLVKNNLRNFQPDKYATSCTFFTKEDKIFRYTRDNILGRENYEKIMERMISGSSINSDGLLDLLWMNKECFKTLHQKQHIIGLHSHSHPSTLNQLSKKEQEFEYSMNYSKLRNVIGNEIFAVSHPSNSYNKDTLDILKNLKIKLGFRADMLKAEHSKLEFPRLDHAHLIKDVRK